MRLFLALPLPPAVADHLDLALGALTAARPARGGGPGPLRWVEPDQRHITLLFLGEVPGGAVPELSADLGRVLAAAAPARLQLRGAGTFSRRTLWVGVHQVAEDDDGAQPDGGARADGGGRADGGARPDGETLPALMSALEDVAEQHTTIARRNRHRAHVTLARARDRRADEADLAALAHALSVYAGPSWRAEAAYLYSSELGAGKGGTPVHEVVETFSLGPADDG
ncbi:2'-5' RNA ligase family protein [Georgenia sp. TF02-10]|uniref:2'-5' RNA ligase family protein n=1 Tax=Georgenia sp. TF02-10 TaxID=2917725 RepID=UPI001FA75B70|nr:2'-5' RNA ligase family protein [Georgenia sp. TF02-10]UNX56017.1 2'-5' RNA ligase family protein [Georgenia sp. TF02-10]